MAREVGGGDVEDQVGIHEMAGRLEALQPAGFPVGQHADEQVGVDDGPRNVPKIGREKAHSPQKRPRSDAIEYPLRVMRLFVANPLPKLNPFRGMNP